MQLSVLQHTLLVTHAITAGKPVLYPIVTAQLIAGHPSCFTTRVDGCTLGLMLTLGLGGGYGIISLALALCLALPRSFCVRSTNGPRLGARYVAIVDVKTVHVRNTIQQLYCSIRVLTKIRIRLLVPKPLVYLWPVSQEAVLDTSLDATQQTWLVVEG